MKRDRRRVTKENMPTEPCIECGHRVSSSADRCPNCGAFRPAASDRKGRAEMQSLAWAGMVGGIVLCVLGGSMLSNETLPILGGLLLVVGMFVAVIGFIMGLASS